MDATELARWTRFAAKGGIGKCTAIQDCVAESSQDLMFLVDDEITVLMQLPDNESLYLGYCEGVVGRFQGSYVHFHSKLKKPVMAKRSSVTSAKSPTPTLKSPASKSPVSIEFSHNRLISSPSQPSDLLQSTPVPQGPGHSPAVNRSNSPPPTTAASAPFSSPDSSFTIDKTQSSSLRESEPTTVVSSNQPHSPLDNTTPLPSQVGLSPQSSSRALSRSSLYRHSFSDSHTEVEDEDDEDDEPNTRVSLAFSDGEVGIGLSLLQDLADGDGDDDWSSSNSHYSRQSPSRDVIHEASGDTTIKLDVEAAESPPSPVVSLKPSERRPSIAPSSSSSKRSEDWEGASDIYDDYRYSRFSLASKVSTFSQGSHPTQNEVPPPVPDAIRQRTRSNDSDASVYTQASKVSSVPRLSIPSVAPLDVKTKSRPSPLELNDKSPLLHTTWGSPVSTPSNFSPRSATFLSPTITSPTSVSGGFASAMRQRLEGQRSLPTQQPAEEEPISPNKSDVNSDVVRQIVVDDDEEQPPTVLLSNENGDTQVRAHSPSSSRSSASNSVQPITTLLTSRSVMNRTPSPPLASPSLEPPPSPMVPSIAPTPAEADTSSSSIVNHLRPSLSELRGVEPGQPNNRRSLFLPHPGAPQPNTTSSGPMYIRDPQKPVHTLPAPPIVSDPSASTAALQILRRYLSIPPQFRGPTIYGITEKDFRVATGPIPIIFTLEQPKPSTNNARPAPRRGMTISAAEGERIMNTVEGNPPRTITPSASTSDNPSGGLNVGPGRASLDPKGGPAGSVLPRANFFPKAATARPRSRSFSSFNSSPAMRPQVAMQKSRDDTTPSSRTPPLPQAGQMKRSTSALASPISSTPLAPLSKQPIIRKSPLSTVSASATVSSSAHAPSPLSLPQYTISAPSQDEKLRSAIQPSTSAPNLNGPLQQSSNARQIPSRPSLGELSSPTSGRPSLGRLPFQGSAGTESPQSSPINTSPPNFTRDTNEQESSNQNRPNANQQHKSQRSVDAETMSQHSDTRSQVVSPPPTMRRDSLRSKLSLPNLRRNKSRQDETSSMHSGNAVPESDTVQVQDMDFELVRPTMAQMQSARNSEDSGFMGPPHPPSSQGRERSSLSDAGSSPLSVNTTPTTNGSVIPNNRNFLRADSPSTSVSSGQRSPIPSDGWQPSKLNGSINKASDSETSMDAHRHRENKWVSIMSTINPASAKKNKKVKKLVLEGIPSSVRYQVWNHLTDGKARCIPGVYAQLGKRGRFPAFAMVERDVQTCCAKYASLQGVRQEVLALLQAYMVMVPDIQYTSGLALMTGQLLLLAPEEVAFWIFVSIMDSYLRPYFATSTIQMEVDAALFSRALENNDAAMAKKVFVEMGILPASICQPWFTSLFFGTLPSDYLHRVWDFFLLEGIPFLIRVGLTLFACCRRQLMECASEEMLLTYLRSPSPNWLPSSSEAFITQALAFKLKDDDLRKQRIKMEAQVKRQTQQNPRMTSTPGSISLPRSAGAA